MSSSVDPLSLEHLRELVQSDEVDTVIVALPDLYGRLVGKRFDAEFFLESVVKAGTHGCNYLLTVDMEMEPVDGYRFANWDQGYGDFHLAPDLQTLRLAAWLPRTALVLCDAADERRHTLVGVAPRAILRRQIDQAAALNLTALAGSELEYYLFRTSYRDAAEAGFNDAALKHAGWYIEDYHLLQTSREEDVHGAARRLLKQSGVRVECTKGEWGMGQQELNVRYGPVLDMADQQVILKQCLKEVADAAGASVSFMAKFSENHAGSSCHLHLSLWNGEQNAFEGDADWCGVAASDVFRWFLAGWMERTPELMAFYAPTVNSYKRFQAGSWAPTRIAWSKDNRTAGFRVVGTGKSLRIECRLPGADCNPYLAYAAALASGLDGIARQLEAPAGFDGNVYNDKTTPALPGSLREAADQLAASDFAKQAFGEDVVEHYAHFFHVEQAAFDKAVTDWERRRYFERI